MKLREPLSAAVYTIFVSSSDERQARKLRQRVKQLVEDVINPSLHDYPEAGVRIALDMWERKAAQRVEPGKSVNDLFVTRALRAQRTLVLLLGEIRSGTRAEVDAVLAEASVELSVLLFDPPSGFDPTKLKELNNYIQAHRHRFLYNSCGKPDSEKAWIELSRTLFDFAFSAMRRQDPRRRDALTVEVR